MNIKTKEIVLLQQIREQSVNMADTMKSVVLNKSSTDDLIEDLNLAILTLAEKMAFNSQEEDKKNSDLLVKCKKKILEMKGVLSTVYSANEQLLVSLRPFK